MRNHECIIDFHFFACFQANFLVFMLMQTPSKTLKILIALSNTLRNVYSSPIFPFPPPTSQYQGTRPSTPPLFPHS